MKGIRGIFPLSVLIGNYNRPTLPDLSKRKRMVECVNCGGKFDANNSPKSFCSAGCFKEYRSKEEVKG